MCFSNKQTFQGLPLKVLRRGLHNRQKRIRKPEYLTENFGFSEKSQAGWGAQRGEATVIAVASASRRSVLMEVVVEVVFGVVMVMRTLVMGLVQMVVAMAAALMGMVVLMREGMGVAVVVVVGMAMFLVAVLVGVLVLMVVVVVMGVFVPVFAFAHRCSSAGVRVITP